MTGLRGIGPRDYEFLRPTAGDPGFSEWEKAAPHSRGVPGLDPFPELDSTDGVRLVPGEQLRERWSAASLRWSTSAQTSKSKLGPTGEIVRDGRFNVALTSHRLAVVVPQEYMSYEGIPGRGATVAPTLGDRLKMRAIRRVGVKIAPKLVDDLLGDLSPRAGHVPLDCIAGLASRDDGRTLVVELRIASPGSGTDAAIRIGLREGNARAALESIVEGIRQRWASVQLPPDFDAAARSIAVEPRSDGVGYAAPIFRAVGSDAVMSGDGERSTPAPIELVPMPPSRQVPPGGWTCADCGHVNPSDQPRCQRCRHARTSTPIARP